MGWRRGVGNQLHASDSQLTPGLYGQGRASPSRGWAQREQLTSCRGQLAPTLAYLYSAQIPDFLITEKEKKIRAVAEVGRELRAHATDFSKSLEGKGASDVTAES